MREPGRDLALEAIEAVLRERTGHLAGTVGAEVEEHHGVAVVHALVMAGEGLDELVAALVLLVVRLDALNRIRVGVTRLRDDVVGALDAFPAVIAVHRPVAAGYGRNAGVDTGVLGKRLEVLLERLDVAGTRMRIDVAAVHEAVEANLLHAMHGGKHGKHLAMTLHGVHATWGHKTQQVNGAADLRHVGHGMRERGVLLDGAVDDGVVDAGKLLEHDAARTDVQVANLGIAHLAGGKAHVLARSAERGVRVFFPKLVQEGLVGLVDGVVVARGREAEAVHDHQERGKMTLSHPYSPAFSTIAAKLSALREAPPTSAPSTSSFSRKPAMFSGLAEPP